MTAAETIEQLVQTYKNVTPQQRDTLIQQWQAMASQLETVKEAEANLRVAVAIACFGDCSQYEGTKALSLGMGYEIKGVFKMNYNVKPGDNLKSAMNLICETPEGKVIAGRLLSWKPSLKVSEYRLLTPIQKAAFDKALTVSPGAPSLELIEPKKGV